MRKLIALVVVALVACSACGSRERSGAETLPTATSPERDRSPGPGEASRSPVPTGAGASDCGNTSVGLEPLTDLGTGTYRGARGGLYPGGTNEPPASHLEAGIRLARAVEPLDAEGNPDPNGNYALVSVGMSNASAEFQAFMQLAGTDPSIDRNLVVVDGAQGGAAAARWTADSPTWQELDARLAEAGVSPQQVQVAWVKQTNQGGGSWPDYAETLQQDLAEIAQVLKSRYPNLKLAYFSSRTYGGYSVGGLNPEPFAYQTGFAVKWLVEAQIEGDPSLDFPGQGAGADVPWMAWGPYLWADGTVSRGDGLRWACPDFIGGGIHPSLSGAQKVAQLLHGFFRTDPTAREWYLENP
jgi:hypothetical protein